MMVVLEVVGVGAERLSPGIEEWVLPSRHRLGWVH